MTENGFELAVRQFAAFLKAQSQSFFLTDQIQNALDEFLSQQAGLEAKVVRQLKRMFRSCPEVFVEGNTVCAMLRPQMGYKRCVALTPDSSYVEEISRGEYLQAKDALKQGHGRAARSGLVIDFRPYFRDFPKIRESAEMGSGIPFLNRHLSAQLYQYPERFRSALLQYLRNRELADRPILINKHISNPDVLVKELQAVRTLLADFPADAPISELEHELRTHGVEPGWGHVVGEVIHRLKLLSQVLDSSDPERFERLLGQMPVVRKVLMVSPHGWFAQENVLGKPDTGGQVTYVLDQARALEHAMRQSLLQSGLDVMPAVVILTRLIPNAEETTCNLEREKIHGTENSWIIRAPFRDEHGEVIPNWISRFHVWPYLEQFAVEARQLIVHELLGKPDLIIGHYSDGNLVAHRIAEELGVTHCACVHALEKTKYILSDLHWADMERNYRFSLQFTADLIAYNSADFIVSSSYREVGGTEDEQGMIEAYDMFSMPGLYRVESGLDPRLARHNIVPPGASEEHFFPYQAAERRVPAVTRRLSERIFAAHPAENCLGELDFPDRPVVFAMARMDRIKNLSGLVELYAQAPELRSHTNLLLVSSVIDAALSQDQEEVSEVRRIHELMHRYELFGQIRWCAARLDKIETGEIYRIAAERKGVFAQPAFMETFGLTVVEAMACGLPVVVTCFGGPAEIVIEGECGLIRNPNDHPGFAAALDQIVSDAALWERFSKAGMERVKQSFTWRQHAASLLRLANVYDYWNHVDVMNRQALDRYIHTLYHAVFRPRTQAMLAEGARP
jgi:sucrose synthase